MNTIITYKNNHLNDDLDLLKDKAIQLVKMSFYKAAAALERPNDFKIPSDSKSLEQKAYKFLQMYSSKNAIKSRELKRKAIAFLNKDENSKKLFVGDLAMIKNNSKKSIIEDARALGFFTNAKFSKPMNDLIQSNKTVLKADFNDHLYMLMGMNLNRIGGTGSNTITGHNELRFNLISLKCLDPVDWEITDFSQDHINMGGMGVDNLNQQINVNQFFIRDFKKNEKHTFTPKKKFVGFRLNTPGSWPRAYNVTMAIAEKDADGGFLDFLKEIWGIVGEIVKELVIAATITIAGTVIGSVIEPGVGTVIGAIVGAVIGFIVQAIFDSLKDDIFDPESQSIALPSNTALFPGNSKTSQTFSTEFTSSNARYLLKYQWELV